MLDFAETVRFKNLDEGNEAYIFVRVAGAVVGLGLMRGDGGDMEVEFDVETLDRLLSALQAARQRVQL